MGDFVSCSAKGCGEMQEQKLATVQHIVSVIKFWQMTENNMIQIHAWGCWRASAFLCYHIPTFTVMDFHAL